MTAIFAAAASDIFECIDASAGDYVTVAYVELNGSGVRDMLNCGAAAQMLTDQAFMIVSARTLCAQLLMCLSREIAAPIAELQTRVMPET